MVGGVQDGLQALLPLKANQGVSRPLPALGSLAYCVKECLQNLKVLRLKQLERQLESASLECQLYK